MVSRTTFLGLACLVVILVGLGGCGSGSNDPMATYQNQNVAWETCDAQRLSAEDATFLEQLGSRVSCADIRVPIDYAHPDQGEIKVAVMRVRGANGLEGTPAILFNPGGPGGDGWAFGLQTARLWESNGTSEDPAVVQAYQQLARTYDLIGFSPRGIGWSTLLICPRTQAPFPVADPTRQLDAVNIGNTLRNSQLIAQSCENQALMPFINTDATARDMDLIRHLLHQDKLNYIGMSYGTWLGNWYASLFPERVGRMLLTGVTDFSIPLSQQILAQDQGLQEILDNIIIPFATRDPGRFGFDSFTTSSSIRQLINGLSDPLHWALVKEFIDTSQLTNTNYASNAALTLRAIQVVQTTINNNPGADEASLTRLINNIPSLVPSTAFDQIARDTAKSLINRYVKPKIDDDNMYWAIVCNDTGTDDTADSWVRKSNENARRYPDFGGAARENPCLYWRKPAIAKPKQQIVAQVGPIMMLQSTRDPLTVVSGAMNSLSLLPNARMVLIDGEITHAPVPPYGTSCVDKPIAEYFLNGIAPSARTTTCAKNP